MKKRTKNESDHQSRHLLSGAQAELLEDRKMLAGNVSVEINAAGDLIVTGDNESNVVALSIDASGQVEVLNNDDPEPDGPTIITTSGLESSRVSGDIIINMKGGDDGVAIVPEGAMTPGETVDVPVRNVRATMGSGNDYMFMGFYLPVLGGIGLGVEGSVRMTGGSGNDQMMMKYSNAGGNVTITGSGGDDIAGMFGSETRGDYSVSGGTGNDRIGLFNSIVDGDANVNAGSGDNYLLADSSYALQLTMRSGGGDDEVIVNQFTSKYDDVRDVYGNAQISTGGGEDQITITDSGQIGRLSVNSGGGNDDIDVEASLAESFRLNAGGGNDDVLLRDSELGSSQIAMGAGNDELNLWFNEMDGRATGNGGSDSFGQFGTVGFVDIVSFESIAD